MPFAIPCRPLLLALALSAAPAAAGSYLVPNPAPAGAGFTLYLNLGNRCNDCGYVSSRESVSVAGTRIDLRYAFSLASGPLPPAPKPGPIEIPAESGPVFSMPALKAGRYEVWAVEMAACLFLQPACALPTPAPIPLGVLEVSSDAGTGTILNPYYGPDGKAVEVQVLDTGYSCATAFDSLSAALVGDTLALAFYDWERPMGCAIPYDLFGPILRIPGLAPGAYPVKVTRLAKRTSAAAGVLRVGGDQARAPGWYLKEPTVAAQAPFRMQLLRDDVGNCQNSFPFQSAALTGQGIVASFVMEYRPEIACVQDLRPHGPVFDPGWSLAPGLYPVLPDEMMPCETAMPACLVKKPPLAPSDTLVVSASVSLPLSAWRARAARAAWRGNTLTFGLPGGPAGSWRAEWLGLDGRLRFESRFQGVPGRTVSLSVAAPPEGLGLLRLTGPGGATHTLPLSGPTIGRSRTPKETP